MARPPVGVVPFSAHTSAHRGQAPESIWRRTPMRSMMSAPGRDWAHHELQASSLELERRREDERVPLVSKPEAWRSMLSGADHAVVLFSSSESVGCRVARPKFRELALDRRFGNLRFAEVPVAEVARLTEADGNDGQQQHRPQEEDWAPLRIAPGRLLGSSLPCFVFLVHGKLVERDAIGISTVAMEQQMTAAGKEADSCAHCRERRWYAMMERRLVTETRAAAFAREERPGPGPWAASLLSGVGRESPRQEGRDAQNCPICMEALGPPPKPPTSSKSSVSELLEVLSSRCCNQRFHKLCLRRCLDAQTPSSTTCPLCRGKA